MGKRLTTIGIIVLAALLVFWDQTANDGILTAFLGDFFVVLVVLAIVVGAIGIKTGL